MRFRCGQCNTNYKYDASKITGNGIILKCKNCDNKFAINKNHVIKSKDDTSVRYCSNCNAAVPINSNKCAKCGLHFNIGKISLIIDNKDYTNIEDETGSTSKVVSFLAQHQKKISAIALPATIALLLILFTPYSTITRLKDKALQLTSNQPSSTIAETTNPEPDSKDVQGNFLISMVDGGQLHASTIRFYDQDVKIIDNKGMEITVNKKNISGIAKIGPGQ